MKLVLGDNIRKLRIENGLTQEQLADHLGVSFQAVSRWERNAAYPDIELLPELAEYFHVSLDELMRNRDSEEDAEREAVRIANERFSLGREITLELLRKLEFQYPNNWNIKEHICSVLVEPPPESYDNILPELKKYTEAALKHFGNDKAAEWFIRAMTIAAPEDEVNEWASRLEEYNLNSRWNIMKIRYQERGDWQKAKLYESKQKIAALCDLISMGPIPEVMDGSLHGTILPAQIAERILDAVVGVPYRDENGNIHNSIMLCQRLEHYHTIVLRHIAEEYCDGSEALISHGLDALETMVDYALLYADAMKEEYFVSDNPYLEPQEITFYWRKDVAEDHYCRERTLDGWIFALRDERFYPPLLDDERFKAQKKRLYDKKAEIAEYWKNSSQ